MQAPETCENIRRKHNNNAYDNPYDNQCDSLYELTICNYQKQI